MQIYPGNFHNYSREIHLTWLNEIDLEGGSSDCNGIRTHNHNRGFTLKRVRDMIRTYSQGGRGRGGGGGRLKFDVQDHGGGRILDADGQGG